MIGFAGGQACFTTNTVSAPGVAQITLYFHISPNDVTEAVSRYLWFAEGTLKDGYSIRVYQSKLYVSYGYDDSDGDNASWNCPISTQEQLVGVRLYVNSSNSAPSVVINGTVQTMTAGGSGSELASLPACQWFFGGYTHYSSTSSSVWNGRIAEVAYYVDAHSDAEMQVLTKTRVKRFFLQYDNAHLVHYWALDETPWGLIPAGNFTILPNEDVSATWSTATPHYSKINVEAGGISAGSSDDGKLEKIGFGTSTIPTGKTVFGLLIIVKGDYDDSASTSFGWSVYTTGTTLVTSGSISSSSPTFFYTYTQGAFTQTNINDMEIWFQARSTIDKDEADNVQYAAIVVYYENYRLQDLKSGNYLLTLACGGQPDKYLSHAT